MRSEVGGHTIVRFPGLIYRASKYTFPGGAASEMLRESGSYFRVST